MIEDFALHFRRPPDQFGPDNAREYIARLFRDRKLSDNSVNQTVGAEQVGSFSGVTTKEIKENAKSIRADTSVGVCARSAGYAQNITSMSGRIVDPSGAAVPNATVVGSETAKKNKRHNDNDSPERF
jgi:hypothetical protein